MTIKFIIGEIKIFRDYIYTSAFDNSLAQANINITLTIYGRQHYSMNRMIRKLRKNRAAE